MRSAPGAERKCRRDSLPAAIEGIPDNIIIKRLPMGFALRERLEPIRKIVSLVFLDSPKTALATIST
jgi:hypothetical protein